MGRGSKHGINRDEWERRRTEFVARGADLPQTKLMPAHVADIRSAGRQREQLRAYIRDNLSNAALAKKFGVHERSIERALTHQNFCHEP